MPCSPWLLIALEESEIFCRNLRGKTAQNILRIMHTGRNRHIQVLAITTDLALLETSFIRLCGLRYHGKLNIEQNSRNKFKAYYGKEWLNLAESLSAGEFVNLTDNKPSLTKTDLFTPETTPEDLIEYLHTVTPHKQQGLFLRLLTAWQQRRGN